MEKMLNRTMVLATLFVSFVANAGQQLYFVHNDHLNTPQALTDNNQQVVWKVEEQSPFGELEVNEDPDGDGNSVAFNLRFPGQYFDEETGTNYNYYRTYDPSLGRYIQSDPIGLGGGINTYGYALQHPINNYDPDGRIVILGIPAIYWGLGLAGGSAAVCMGTNCGEKVIDTFDDSMQMAGAQTFPNPISHRREKEILNNFPGPNCPELEEAIRDLKKTIEWRKGDLNPLEKGTVNYVNHVRYIRKLESRLEALQREARILGCDPDCD